MTLVGITSLSGRDHTGVLHAQLAGLVRPEFGEPIIPLDVDHPVFARGRCEVSRRVVRAKLTGRVPLRPSERWEPTSISLAPSASR